MIEHKLLTAAMVLAGLSFATASSAATVTGVTGIWSSAVNSNGGSVAGVGTSELSWGGRPAMATAATVSSPPVSRSRRFDEFIHEGLSGQLTLEQLAQIAGLSPSHFIRAFRQTTGQTPYRYIFSCRLIRAQEMIRENRATIGEIARSVGFSSNSHMTAMMKRNRNTTPTQLRLSGG